MLPGVSSSSSDSGRFTVHVCLLFLLVTSSTACSCGVFVTGCGSHANDTDWWVRRSTRSPANTMFVVTSVGPPTSVSFSTSFRKVRITPKVALLSTYVPAQWAAGQGST